MMVPFEAQNDTTSNQSPPSIFAEIAELFASCPQTNEILSFRPSESSSRRAEELLQLNRQDQLSKADRRELEQFEAAELLMRLVKARIRSGKSSQTTD